jgi:hypothetical protein
MERAGFARTIERLIDGWCEKRKLQPLRLILPVYPLSGGLTEDWGDLHAALRQVRISCRDELDETEMDAVIELIHEVERVLER